VELRDKMIKLDGMLMIGSARTNVGKTELACALIRKFSKSGNITGIKVTTIKEKNGQCPRGGEGCGVCSSLDGVYCITEETDNNSDKDTARLLAAGASRVFWLRVLKEHLPAGTTALLDVIGPDAVSICESNSLRQVVEPGLFLMARSNDSKVWKSSAEEVRKYADRNVVSDGSDFDFDLDRIKLVEGKWTMQAQATAVIMAGGGSSRMGTDKSMLPIKGKLVITRICEQLRGCFDQILISADEAEKFAFLGFEVVPDKMPEQGPLMGIASALEASASELNFVVACDIPNIDIGCVRKLLAQAIESRADIVIPITEESGASKTKKRSTKHAIRNTRYEPLFAVYRKSALGAINKVLSSGGHKISDAFALCKVEYVKLDSTQWLVNINTMAEYEEFRRKCEQRAMKCQ
jgi:molybdopterin-guanine dinucleotide biosynthesis protein A